MGYVLAFMAGGVFGFMASAVFAASGKESELERKLMDDGK